MLFCIIPPQIPERLHTVIWDILESHGLDPTPLIDCARISLTSQQIRALSTALEFAPIPPFEPNQRPYVMILLESPNPAANRFLNDALGGRIKYTADIPRFEGGIRRHGPVSGSEHPNAFLRELIIVPSDKHRKFVTTLFAQAESAAA